jgi:hypothetical protein
MPSQDKEFCDGCPDCEADKRLATKRIRDHAKRGKGITLFKMETKIIAIMLEGISDA